MFFHTVFSESVFMEKLLLKTPLKSKNKGIEGGFRPEGAKKF